MFVSELNEHALAWNLQPYGQLNTANIVIILISAYKFLYASLPEYPLSGSYEPPSRSALPLASVLPVRCSISMRLRVVSRVILRKYVRLPGGWFCGDILCNWLLVCWLGECLEEMQLPSPMKKGTTWRVLKRGVLSVLRWYVISYGTL